MSRLLAHSPRRTVGPQYYDSHVRAVERDAYAHASAAARYYAGNQDWFREVVLAAARYHDLGKLDEQNQEVLRRVSREPLPVAHEDAGVAELVRAAMADSAMLVAAHHVGLSDYSEELGKQERAYRNLRVADHVDARLDDYLALHRSAGCWPVRSIEPDGPHLCGLTRRLALSCLVDADHGDTARHYGNEVPLGSTELKWEERLARLDRYVADLPRTSSRDPLRHRVYRACRGAAIEPAIRACNAPVGSGKTTAVMAHLLRVAAEKRLRHVIVVLPYTNIIKQSVQVYREALTLPGEDPFTVVAEHHHQADFKDLELRQLTTLWRAPVVVTTAVQFFETLAASHPGRLRKLHELPGSAVFVDETHAAIPSHLWPQVWRWLETWTRQWSGHLVLASGSLPRFWELEEFVQPPKRAEDVPDLVPAELRHELQVQELERITPLQRVEPVTADELIRWVTGTPGPRLLILNTVQSAAVIADRMRRAGHDVLHLSTALAPVHRELMVERVKERLRHSRTHESQQDWTLVATSCVEAGMNVSFRVGFRERGSTASLIQVGGRISRGAEYPDAVVWDFCLTHDGLLRAHPGLKLPARVLKYLFDEGKVDRLPPSELALEAMRRELTEGDLQRAERLSSSEAGLEYREVSNCCRVIEADTRTVVIDPDLVAALERGDPVGRRHLLRHSVQVWSSKIDRRQLPVSLLSGEEGDPGALYAWSAEYDPDFLGYMAGALQLLERLRDAVFVA